MEEDRGKSKKKKDIIIIIIVVIFVSLLVLLFLLPGTVIKFAEPDDLELTISSEEDIINKTQNESFMVNVELANVVDDDLFIYYDFSINGILEFKITTPSNNEVFPIHPHTSLTENYIVGNRTLSSSESIKMTVDIFDYDYSLDQSGEDPDMYDWNETGIYKIQFEYRNFNNDYEIIKSNIVEFEIV
jgi:hypothetical protein